MPMNDECETLNKLSGVKQSSNLCFLIKYCRGITQKFPWPSSEQSAASTVKFLKIRTNLEVNRTRHFISMLYAR